MSEAPRAIMQGMLVVDMTSAVFGPSATGVFGDLGAEVIKIESAEGDSSRRAGPARSTNMAPLYVNYNRNKRCITLDLKLASDLEVVTKLLAKADVFIHNVRAAGIERLGLDYPRVKAINPNLIYVHCVGYGSRGPYAPKPAYDELIQAGTGIASLQTLKDGDPAPRLLPTLVPDKLAGLTATYATFAALFHRERTGEAQHVEVPLFESALFSNLAEHMAGETFIPPSGPVGYRYNLERDPFRTLDGYVAMFPQPRLWREFAEWGGRLDLLDDPVMQAFGRGVRGEGLWRVHQEIIKNRTSDFWLEIFAKHNMPAVRVVGLEDVLHDPHVEASEFFEIREHPTEGTYRAMRNPVDFAATPARIYRDAPRMNDDEAYIRALAES